MSDILGKKASAHRAGGREIKKRRMKGTASAEPICGIGLSQRRSVSGRREEIDTVYMKKRLISALLAGVMCVFCVLPAGAAATGRSADAAQTADAGAPALTYKSWGLGSVKKAVQENNPTAQALMKTAAGIDTASDISNQLAAAGLGLQAQIEAYQKMIDDMTAAMGASADETLKATYQAQIAYLQATVDSLTQSKNALPVQQQSAVSKIEDAEYQLRSQAENIADQMTLGAQKLLITLQTLEYSQDTIARNLAMIDRNLAVLRVQRSIGMASELAVDTLANQRDDLAMTQQTLANQVGKLQSNLALMCGLDAGTAVRPSAFQTPNEWDLRKMSLEKDTKTALDNSFSIWQKRVKVRAASNQDDSYDGVKESVAAAKEALAAEQQSVETSFKTIYQTVSDCWLTEAAAETALRTAQTDLRTSEVRYKRGMISRLAYQQAQDAVDTAQGNLKTAQLKLLSAYNTY